MHSLHLKQELILSLDMVELPKVKEFLKTLDVSSENGEAVDCLINHKKCVEHVRNIETQDGEHLIVICGSKKITIILKKNKKFAQIKKKLFSYINF
jgi:hypothetical protein